MNAVDVKLPSAGASGIQGPRQMLPNSSSIEFIRSVQIHILSWLSCNVESQVEDVRVGQLRNQNIICSCPVREVEDCRIEAAVVRLIPGSKGQTSSVRGEGVDAHVLVTSSREQQLVVGDRGAVHKSRVIDNRTARNVAHPGSRHGIEAIVQLQAIGGHRGFSGGNNARRGGR